jgi:hypothetical protein
MKQLGPVAPFPEDPSWAALNEGAPRWRAGRSSRRNNDVIQRLRPAIYQLPVPSNRMYAKGPAATSKLSASVNGVGIQA